MGGLRGPCPSQYSDFKNPLGNHLPCIFCEHVLDGYYVDFIFLKPESNVWLDWCLPGKERSIRGSAECSFPNWLMGYIVYTSIVASAYRA